MAGGFRLSVSHMALRDCFARFNSGMGQKTVATDQLTWMGDSRTNRLPPTLKQPKQRKVGKQQ